MSSGSRTNRSTARRVITTLDDLRTDVDGLKSGVQFFGPDALTIKRSGRTTGWDVSDSIAPYALKSYRCSFTSDTLIDPYVEFWPNITIVNQDYFEVVTIWPDPNSTGTRTRGWIVTLSNDANTVTFQIAAAFKCTDTGTVTVAAI